MMLEAEHQYERKLLRIVTPLDKVLKKRGMTHELFKYYKGTLNKCILCIDPLTQIEEYHDISATTDLVIGMEIIIENNNILKGAILSKVLYGIFHKWEMVSGKYFVLSQSEVDTLTKTEKRELRMSL